MLTRLRGLVALGLVAQRPDLRPNAGPKAVVYVTRPHTAELLAALDRTPLHARTATERALRDLATVLYKSVNLEPGTEGRRAAESAVAALRTLWSGWPGRG